MEARDKHEPEIVELEGEEIPEPPKLIDCVDHFKDVLGKYRNVEPDRRPCVIVDNGSYNCRAGWSFESDPYLTFKSAVAKPRTFSKDLPSNIYLVGSELSLLEASRIQKRNVFDRSVLTHADNQEYIFDYIFSHLGVTGSSVAYPVLLTEPFCNPNYSRTLLTTLLFESYNIPYLCLSVDFLLSLYSLSGASSCPTGLIISSGHNSTHCVPLMNSRVDYQRAKRVNIGGKQGQECISKSLGLRYQVHKAKITESVVEEIWLKHTACASDYKEQLRFLEANYERETKKLKEAERLKREILLEGKQLHRGENEKTKEMSIKVYRNMVEEANEELGEDLVLADRIVQLEWVREEEPSEEEVKRKEQMRKEQGQRLREINAKKREEKNKKMLKELEKIEPYQNDKSLQDDPAKLKELGFKTFNDLLDRLEILREKLNISEKVEKPEEEKWPLINIDDNDLDEEQKKLKRIQKMQKSSYLKRMEKRIKLEAEKAKIAKLKSEDPQGYLENLYKKRKHIYKRIEQREERREQMKKRDGFNRKMKTIAKIGGVEEDTAKNKKKGLKNKKNEEDEDDFGANDEDWDLYKDISKHGFEEGEEEDQQALDEINEQIAEVDPNFNCLFNENEKQKLTEEDFQLRLSTDRFRGAELMFQPSIIGCEFAGVTEVLENIFRSYSPEEAALLGNNVYITGGNSKIYNFENRIRAEIQMLRPPNTPLSIVKSYQPELDAWKGGALYAQREDFIESTCITKAQYEECGPYYLQEHFTSNIKYGEALEASATSKTQPKRQKVVE